MLPTRAAVGKGSSSGDDDGKPRHHHAAGAQWTKEFATRVEAHRCLRDTDRVEKRSGELVTGRAGLLGSPFTMIVLRSSVCTYQGDDLLPRPRVAF